MKMNSISTASASPFVYDSYGLSSAQNHDQGELFDALFTWQTGHDTPKLDAAFTQLETSVKARNIDSIEMLTNLALRDDGLGKRAERLLFAEFSAPSTGWSKVSDDISKAALALNVLYINSPAKFVDAQAKLGSPSLLLYMAGAGANVALQRKMSEEIFSKGIQAVDPREQVSESNVWAKNRLVAHDELACAVKQANRQAVNSASSKDSTEHFNSPLPLIAHGESCLGQVIDSMKQQKDSNNDWPQFFPVNTGGHWVLFGIYKSGVDELNAFVFSSTELDVEVKKNLQEAACVAGVGTELVVMDKNLQTHVPNGCGLFVADAIRSLANAPRANPKSVVAAFQEKALAMSSDAGADYNLFGRRELFGVFLDGRSR